MFDCFLFTQEDPYQMIDGNKTDGLVPYADMLNHRRPRETKWTFSDARYGFIITSLKTIQRGEQVCPLESKCSALE